MRFSDRARQFVWNIVCIQELSSSQNYNVVQLKALKIQFSLTLQNYVLGISGKLMLVDGL